MKELEIYILAGGKSSRMGSDKGLVKITGKPMIQYLIESIGILPYPLRIIAHDPAYRQFDLKVIEDTIPEKGPLGGLLTALTNAKGNNVCLLSCDMPFLNAETLNTLITQSKENYITVSKLKDRTLPFPGVYPASLISAVEEHVVTDKLKLQSFIQEKPHQFFALDERFKLSPIEFININKPTDIAQAATWLKKNH